MVNFGDGFKKVQVKTSTNIKKSGSYSFEISRTRFNNGQSVKKLYTKDEVDYFYLHDIDNNSWLIPFDKVKDQRTIVPAIKFNGYKISTIASSKKQKAKKQKEHIKCDKCNNPLKKRTKTGLCRHCYNSQRNTKIKWPKLSILLDMVDKKSYSGVGRDLGVSDNAVRKHIKTKMGE